MSASELATLSISLVELSTTQHKTIASHLNGEGIVQINSVDSGEEAIHFIQKYPPDLVISSMHLPDTSAMDLLAKLQPSVHYDALNFMLISS